MAKIVMPDAQEFPIEDETAASDELLRATLRAAYPDAANATFTREGGKDGQELVVKVAKKAGTKGAGILPALLAAPEGINPAVVMQRRVAEIEKTGGDTHLQFLAIKPEIDDAIKAGGEEIKATEKAMRVLFNAPTEASTTVPPGF